MNNRTSTIGISTFIITAVMAGPATGQSDIPAHPDDLRFEPLVFSPPSRLILREHWLIVALAMPALRV